MSLASPLECDSNSALLIKVRLPLRRDGGSSAHALRIRHAASGSVLAVSAGVRDQSLRAARQAKLADGSLAVSVLRDADRAFWTRTVWRDEAAMRSFMRSGGASPHHGAAPRMVR